MKNHIVKIISTQIVTHDVMRFTVEKPEGYTYTPGQATQVSVNTLALKNEKKPFTFTSLNNQKHLEFIIKIYNSHNGVTKELGKLKAGDELIIHDVWGAIKYKGKGVFIAGGSGVTPFIAIFRQLYSENNIAKNKLIFTNKTESDIILKEEFNEMLGKSFINILTDENKDGYENSRIDMAFLKENITDFTQNFYICGPPEFVVDISEALKSLGAKTDAVVFEK
ncbi:MULTISPECIES: FAD-binding oxidoreductase [unclassified Polaribacter]|uniref:FAD-binding oxidoreductase n=1 Tax=unclassified Polaribacter TaxID=196858 RepID=UPI0011BEE4C5|nr:MULTISPECIES: FAD-binding oxidoreductase [unclassified Polaribacter]TXD52000.1 flavodoxin reductase [Polaribacter sp. IC063]TXD58669.1 flavodoxin reductase [Polaribacter sp. IC066]